MGVQFGHQTVGNVTSPIRGVKAGNQIMNDFKPAGWPTVTPRLLAKDVPKFVQFLKDAFEATGDLEPDRPTEIRIGESLLMVSGTDVREPMTAFLYVYVNDADKTYSRAVSAGAESIEEPRDTPYGDRRAMVRDPAGNIWQIATHKQEAFEKFMREHS
jgi:PhnB protein